jgi:hypothetical protein
LQDDTAGGDTNHDGEASRARPGDWKGIAGSGVLNVSESTQVRYATASHSGTLGSNQTWDGNWVHVIGDEVVVPAGVTLSIEPGSIVKFAAGKRLRVQAGGTTSTLAWPRAGTAAPCAGGRNPSGLRRRGPADLLHLPA